MLANFQRPSIWRSPTHLHEDASGFQRCNAMQSRQCVFQQLHLLISDLTHPPSWRWRIIRRGKPMGVLLEAGGFSTYEAARFAGNVALADFLEQLEREKFRND